MLKRRVQIQKPVTTTDSEGTESVVWWPVATLWSQVTELQGHERLEAEQPQFPRTVQVLVRNQPTTPIAPAMRIAYGVRVFEIQAVIPDQEPPRWLMLHAMELHP